MSSLASVALGALDRSARVADAVRRPRPGTVVLIYHRVGSGSGMKVDLPVAQFDEQVAAIASRAATLDDALDGLEAADAPTPTESTFVVTFDDGTVDIVDHALPVLVEHGVPVVVYLATQFVDEGLPFDFEGTPGSWSAWAEALSTGLVTIGSHTHSHTLLDRVEAGVAADELDRSIGLIEDNLGVTPHHFAYPKALLGSPGARREVAARFRSAAVSGGRPNLPGRTDPQRLLRTPVQTVDGADRFSRKMAGGLSLEDDVRRLAGRVRYRSLTT